MRIDIAEVWTSAYNRGCREDYLSGKEDSTKEAHLGVCFGEGYQLIIGGKVVKSKLLDNPRDVMKTHEEDVLQVGLDFAKEMMTRGIVDYEVVNGRTMNGDASFHTSRLHHSKVEALVKGIEFHMYKLRLKIGEQGNIE